MEMNDKWVLDSSLVHYNETFEVTVHRNGLGLGFSIIEGESGIRIKKIFPLQPAWETGKLRQGDILLKVSGIPVDTLTVRKALDVLRSSPPATVLTICRPFSQTNYNNGGSTTSVMRSYSFTPVNTSSIWEGNPLIIPSPTRCDRHFNNNDEDIHSTIGEFIVTLNKVNGSLGFTLKASEDTTIMRHSIKALVKEPAISNGLLKPGDKLISANNVDCSKFSHSELVQFLRHCPERVVLKLYRDASRSQTPITSPDKPLFENNNILENPLKSHSKMLRYEAMEMVKSLQASRSSLQDSNGSTSSLNRRKVGGESRPYSPKPKYVTALLTPASSLPVIESPDTDSEIIDGNHSLPPMYIAQSMERLQIEEVANDIELSPCNSGSSLVRPDSLDLSRRRQKSYAFHSINN
ncbi:disks large homolog 1 [Lepeophtheirus salmonis]|uniref:PDZ domain-containing protein n=1 Tax=Lepeophtheirus salmonis TaxID=72036 RepID=A0A0K2VIT8_LEPSM